MDEEVIICDLPVVNEKDHEFNHFKCLPTQHKKVNAKRVLVVPLVFGVPGVMIRKE